MNGPVHGDEDGSLSAGRGGDGGTNGPADHRRNGPGGGRRPHIPAQREQHGSSDDLPPVPGAGAGSSAGSAAGAAEAAPVRLDPPEPPTPPDPLRRIDPGASSAVTSDRVPPYDHGTLKSLLGAWALAACSRDETLAVEVHLTDCAGCADEALRLRDAVGLLHHEESLDLDPLLRARVLEGCLGRRPARIPVPEWAGPYDAEAARLDALLRDLGDGYWTAPVRLQWFDGAPVSREFTVGQVIAHLIAVDGLVGRALGLPQQSIEPPAEDATDRLGLAPMRPVRLGETTEEVELPRTPVARTAAHWAVHRHLPGATLRLLWREQSHRLVRTVAFAGEGVAGLPVDYGDFELAFHDAFVDRAFECWTHATDIAEAVDYPYEKPALGHMRQIVGLAADKLPGALAARRRAGLTTSASRLVAAGSPGRSLLLEIEGDGGGEWWLPLDSPGAMASPDHQVAHVAMDSVEFCQLTAGHVVPERAAAGKNGDRAAIRDVLYAAASLSRL